MKKILILLLLGVMTNTLAACEDTYDKVPLILYSESDPYIAEFKQHILTAASGNIIIDAYDSKNSQLLQNEYIDDILEKDPQILIVNPVDRLGAFTIIEKVRQHDIPIIFINREPLEDDMNSWNKLYYIGAPAENSAVIQSEMIIDLFGEHDDLSELDKNSDGVIQLIVLKGEQGHQDAEIRTDVVLKELEDYGYQLEILAIEICDWQRIIAFDKMDEFLNDTNKEVELVISNNDAMALGAIDAMIEHELFVDVDEDGIINPEVDTWVPVIGIDGISDVFEYIESGYLYGTVINDSETMSQILVELIEAILDGTSFDDLSFEIVDDKYIWVDYRRYEKEKN